MKNSISLIGMAGAGKSSVGKELARTLGFSFIDSDALIEKQHGKVYRIFLMMKATLN